MAAEIKRQVALEIAHVLFIDIVAYSRMPTDQQRAVVDKLNQIVQSTDEFRKAESENRLLKLATGDGMALIFYHSPEDPVECALEISRAIKEQHANLRLRMGVHSGPVSGVVDVNGRANVAGVGINVAQRIMDCGDAGHILLSKRVAEDLEQFAHWRPHLYHLGEYEVKHGEKIEIVNLFTAELGNSERPQRLIKSSGKPDVVPVTAERPRSRKAVPIIGAVVVIAVLAFAAFFFWQRQTPKTSALGSDVPPKSVAVLPFENLSSDKENAFFTDGVQDQILTNLAQIADLKVISRTSVMQYKTGAGRNLREIAQQLGVAHLLEGSVQRAANKVRVNAQLINARTDAHLWAQTYDRDLADVFAIQSEIAKAIADQLQAKLSPNEKKAIEQAPTTDVSAFDLYSRAKTLFLRTSFAATGEQNLREAMGLLTQAVTRDPAFFEAYCLLARVHESAYALGTDHTPARLAQAEAALQAATRLRPDAGETHLSRAEYLYYGLRDYNGALAELDLARRSLPNDPRIFELTGYIARRRGQPEEGLRQLERAIGLDPRNFFTLQQMSLSYQNLRRFADARAALDRALSIVPDHVETRTARAQIDLYWKADTRPLHQTIDSILAQGSTAIAPAADTWFLCALAERDTAAAERALVALGDNPFWGDDAIILSHKLGEGLLARMKKDETKARAAFAAARAEQEKVVQAQPDYGPTLCALGLIDAALGHKETALGEGRRAIALLPVEKDVTNGSRVMQYFAIIAAWAGEKDLALQQLEIGLRAPAASILISYGGLKLLPFWDPLRGDPRFEKIVADLAPK